MWRQVSVQIVQFVVERERPFVMSTDHSHNAPPLHADEVGVVPVELVYQPFVWVLRMLRNLLDEGTVVERVDLLELPVLGRYPELQR